MNYLLDCPYCRYLVPSDTKICPLCDQSLTVAILKCIKPIANIPVGKSWELYPRDYKIGRHPSNDIVISGEYISRHHLNLIYNDTGFKMEIISKNKLPEEDTVRMLGTGETFYIGEGMFSLQYICNFAKYGIVNTQVFPVLMSSDLQLAYIDNAQDMFNFVSDCLLRITKFEKAYFFKVVRENEKYKLLPLSARTHGFTSLDYQDVPVSQTFLKKVFDSPKRIIVRTATDISKSIIALQLESIVCIPIVNTDGIPEFILYADTKEKISEQNLMFLKPPLKVMRKMIVNHLLRLNIDL